MTDGAGPARLHPSWSALTASDRQTELGSLALVGAGVAGVVPVGVDEAAGHRSADLITILDVVPRDEGHLPPGGERATRTWVRVWRHDHVVLSPERSLQLVHLRPARIR